MQNLLQFIFRYSSFFTFIILEAICIYFLVTYNSSQREIYLHSSNLAVGRVYESVSEVKSYANLNEINDSLARENARLRAKLLSITGDSIVIALDTPDYKVIPCEIINNNILSRNNMMTLDKGKNDGLHNSMGLIDDKGIVGITRSTGSRYTTAYSILNTELRISAKIKRSRHFGTLVWTAEDIRYMTLRSIPKHADVKLGDTVATTAFSTIFPPDIPIGLVDNIEQPPGRNDFSIRVKLFNDLSKISVVYAVEDVTKRLKVNLEKQNDE